MEEITYLRMAKSVLTSILVKCCGLIWSSPFKKDFSNVYRNGKENRSQKASRRGCCQTMRLYSLLNERVHILLNATQPGILALTWDNTCLLSSSKIRTFVSSWRMKFDESVEKADTKWLFNCTIEQKLPFIHIGAVEVMSNSLYNKTYCTGFF